MICIFLCGVSLIKAQLSSPSLFEVATQKELKKDFEGAAIVYERIIFDATDDSVIFKAVIGKVNCYKQKGDFVSAYNYLQKNSNIFFSDTLKCKIYEQWILCAYLTNKLEQCISLIEQARVYFPNLVNHNRLSFFKILSLNEQHKWIEAKVNFIEWLNKVHLDTSTYNLYAKIPKLKSSKKAEALSTFLPGAGQIYANKPLEGFTSILLQGAGVYYGVINFYDKYYFSSWLVGLGLAGSFHFGGVRRAEELVRVYNLKKTSNYNAEVRSKIIEVMSPYLQ